MTKKIIFAAMTLFAALVVVHRTPPAIASDDQTVQLPGLSQPVEILTDRCGISHIYAQNEDDLFFAQGYNVARDRLFQLEIWPLQATGTVAQILARKALNCVA